VVHGQRFDRYVRSLATSTGRRGVVGGFVTSVVALGVVALGKSTTAAPNACAAACANRHGAARADCPKTCMERSMAVGGEIPLDRYDSPFRAEVRGRSGAFGLDTLFGGAKNAATGARPFTGKVYHGSALTDLTYIAANPPERRGTYSSRSFLGAFVSANPGIAESYAYGYGMASAPKHPGQLYEADLHLRNPYHMDYSEFMALDFNPKLPRSIRKTDRHNLDAVAQFKDELIARGHDGIVTHARDPRRPASRTLDPLLTMVGKIFPRAKQFIENRKTTNDLLALSPEIVAFHDIPVTPVKPGRSMAVDG
jgi:hypothetical protein